MKLRKSILTPSQLRNLLRTGYLNKKGRRVAKSALMGKYNKWRYRK